MSEKPTYEELEQRIKELEKDAFETKQGDALERLRQSEAFLQSVFRVAPIGIGVVVKRRLKQVNMRMCEMIGYSQKELLGQNARMLYPTDEDYEYVGREKYIQIRDHGTGTVETRWQRRDGQIIDILMSSTPIDHSDLFKGVTFTALDITERKRAAKTLWESKEQLHSLLQNIQAAVVVHGPDTKIINCNKLSQELLGLTESQMLGKQAVDPAWKFFNEDGSVMPLEQFPVNQVLTTKNELKNFIVGVYRPNKKDAVTLLVHAVPVFDHDSNISQVIVTFMDITESRQMEARLRQSQKMEAVGTLASGVAHDLNNILSGIISYPDLMLLDIPDDSPLREPLYTIKNSGEKAAAIVQDLLTLARRGLQIDQVVNMKEVVEEYLSSPEFRSLRSFHSDVDIETKFRNGLLHIEGSPVHLSKTVMNLVSNAAEAMMGGGKIQILLENRYVDHPIGNYEQVEEGDYVVLKVSDTGSGIEAEDIGRIFEPFYTKKKMGRSGTGLGMAVVWGTVKDHNGYINVRSKPGEGSQFTLYFPVTRVAVDEGEKKSFHIEQYMGKGEFVLIVDDVADQRKIATSIVERLGYRSASVSSGEAAIEYLKNNEVDMLLLDMIMEPGINGLETYKRAINFRPGLKAIIASGFSESNHVREAQRLGVGKYIKKPYTMESLAKAIKEELARQQDT